MYKVWILAWGDIAGCNEWWPFDSEELANESKVLLESAVKRQDKLAPGTNQWVSVRPEEINPSIRVLDSIKSIKRHSRYLKRAYAEENALPPTPAPPTGHAPSAAGDALSEGDATNNDDE